MKKTLFNSFAPWKTKSRKIILPVFLLFAMLAASLVVTNPVMAAAKTASVSGNWNNTATWGGSSVPVAGDAVTINSGVTVTVTAVAACASINFLSTATNNSNLNINTGITLTVSGAITIPRPSSSTNTINVGAGTLNAGSITFTNGGGTNRHQIIISTGTVAVSGDVTESGSTGSATITFTGAGLLQLGGALFSSSTGTLTTVAGSTVEYNGAAQTVQNFDYGNLILSGSGVKTLQNGITIGGNLSLSGTARVTTAAALAIGGNLIVGDGTTFTAAGYNLTVTGTTVIGGGTSGTLAISSATGTKTFTGLVTVNNGGTWNNSSANEAVTFQGGITSNGTFTAGTGVQTFSTNAQTLVGTLSIPNVTINGITVTNNAALTVTSALAGNGGLTNGATGTLNINFTGAPAITTLTATASGNMVNYGYGGSQVVFATNYSNLVLSNSGTKTLQTGTTTISGNLSLSGTAVASIPAGATINVNSLTLGGTNEPSGTWGSTSSPATNTNNTYFAATTGMLNVTIGALTITSTSPLPSGTVGVSYSQTLSAAGGSGTGYTWTITSGTLPGGLSLDPTGVLSGTPTAVFGPSDVTFKVTDSASNSATKPLSITVTGSSPAPAVTGISPNSGTTAGGTSVVITGTNFTGVSSVSFGITSATDYIVNSTTQITATSPAGSAGTVDITVTTASGTSATGPSDQFTYVTAPTITGISPSSGPLAGGTSVTITGTSFTGATAVKFGTTAAANYNVVSATHITATSPAGSAGTVDITVTTASGTSATGSSDQFTYVAAPTVTGISPSSGPLAGGTSVTITGTSFTGATAVKFGTTAAANYNVVSATQVTATSPAGSAGTVDITVTTASGTSATGPSDQFTYVVGPTVTGISPSSGPLAGGTSVTITGTSFTGATAVKFGTTAAANYNVVSATQITATSPAGSAGTVDITVTTASGTSATGSGDQFTYRAAPTVTGISPSSGTTLGGTSITITGTNFVSGATVTVGGTAATGISVVSTTSITATTPVGTAGAQNVVVTNPDGQSGSLSAGFTYVTPAPSGGGGVSLPGPTVVSISPSSGTTAGGINITITGANFIGGATVTVGGTAATGISVVSTTSITATTPVGTAGAQNVVVTNPDGQSSTLSGGFTYLAPAPTVTSISPNSGPIAGGTNVTIGGKNFVSGATVTIGGTAATGINVASSTAITATTPAGTAGVQNVVVTNPDNQSGTLSGGFTYLAPAPTVTSISPNSGPIAGGTNVTIAGMNFVSGATVTIGGTAATGINVASSTAITATTPAGTAGVQNVVVTNPDSQSGSLLTGFTYETPTPTTTPAVTTVPNDQNLISQFITENGTFTQSITISSHDTVMGVTIGQGIRGIDSGGQPLSYITISPITTPPAPSAGNNMIGLAYNFLPAGSTFSQPITISFRYDPIQLPAGANENSLTIDVWNTTTNRWEATASVVDPATHVVSTQVTHFSQYALMLPTSPADFIVSGLTITPPSVDIHKVVTISALVINTGDITGTYQVSLKINNVPVETKDVTLAGKASLSVTFTPLINTVGSQAVDVNGETSSFTVNPTPALGNWSYGVIIVAFFIGIGLAVLLLNLRDRSKNAAGGGGQR